MWRVNFLIGAVFAAAGLIGYQLFNLAWVRHETLAKAAQAQQARPAALAGRGAIYFSDYNTGEKKLAAASGKNNTRLYPLGASAGQTLGFVGYDGNRRVGQYGVEGYYDAELAAGSDLLLTIDKNIQEMAEQKLGQVMKKWSAAGGTIIIEDPKSGAILALAASPSFDPNHYGNFELADFLNPAQQGIYEPGSSFKPITMAAALDAGAVKPETGYEDTGAVQSADYTIKNFDEQAHGWQTMRQVLQKSLNLGAIFAEQKTGDDAFLNYVVNFGFGQKSGIDLPGELVGNISNLYSGRKINFLTAAFGQGIAVTPIQLVNAYAAIANGGKLSQPHLIRELTSKDGDSQTVKPKLLGQPIGAATAKTLQGMLVDVVDKGFDKARVSGYDVAGKTGTAQIPNPNPNPNATSADEIGYLSNQFIHNFVGFAPAYDARFVALIKLDRPKGIKFAADSLSPVFGDIARYLLRYFNVPPTRAQP